MHQDVWGVKKQAQMRSAIIRGCLMAVGPEVDELATALAAVVTSSAAARREARDGKAFHITLVAKAELAQLSKQACKELEAAAARLSPKDCLHLGVGTATRGADKAWFVVLLWPGLQMLREQAGLAHSSPHITLGFDGADVHECSKGALQLMAMSNMPPAALPPRNWDSAAEVIRRVARSSRALHGEEAVAETLCALEILEAEASINASEAVQAELLVSRCELKARLQLVGAAEWANDAEAAVALNGRSARAWLNLARARCAQRQIDGALEAARTASLHAERANDVDVGVESANLISKIGMTRLDAHRPPPTRNANDCKPWHSLQSQHGGAVLPE